MYKVLQKGGKPFGEPGLRPVLTAHQDTKPGMGNLMGDLHQRGSVHAKQGRRQEGQVGGSQSKTGEAFGHNYKVKLRQGVGTEEVDRALNGSRNVRLEFGTPVFQILSRTNKPEVNNEKVSCENISKSWS